MSSHSSADYAADVSQPGAHGRTVLGNRGDLTVCGRSAYWRGSYTRRMTRLTCNRREALTWAQRLKSLVRIDIETFRAFDGTFNVIAVLRMPR